MACVHRERLSFLKNKGFFPAIIYDIGAFNGWWTWDIQPVFPASQFFLFEANEVHAKDLSALNCKYFINLLGDAEKESDFYSINLTGDSVFIERTSAYIGKPVLQRRQMTTLSSLVQKQQIPLPDLVKLDVQGAEKIVIQGGCDIVSHAEVIILETRLIEYNMGAPLIYELMTLMNDLNYQMVDVVGANYLNTQELVEMDVLFIKKKSKLIR